MVQRSILSECRYKINEGIVDEYKRAMIVIYQTQIKYSCCGQSTEFHGSSEYDADTCCLTLTFDCQGRLEYMQSADLWMTSPGCWRGHDAQTRQVFLRWLEDLVQDPSGYWKQPALPPPSDPPPDALPLSAPRSLLWPFAQLWHLFPLLWPFAHRLAAITAAAAA